MQHFKLFIMSVGIVALLSATLFADGLKVGYVEFPPYTYTANTGKPAGLFIALSREVYGRLNMSVESETSYPAARLVKYLITGEVDVWYGIKLPALETSAVYGNEPIGSIELNIYAINKVPEIDKKEDLNGKKIILILGYGYSDWGAWIKDPKNKIEYFQTKSHEVALNFLELGRADYLLDYTYTVNNALKKHKVTGLVKKKLQTLNCYFSVSKKTKKHNILIRRFDKALKSCKENSKSQKYKSADKTTF